MSAVTVAHDCADEPLPRLRALPVPVAEPHPGLRLVTREETLAVIERQETLLLATAPPGRGRRRPGPRAPGPRPASPQSSVDELPARDGQNLPEPRAWAGRYVQAAVEIAAGMRPPAQLARWSSADVHTLLGRRYEVARKLRADQPARSAYRARVTTVLACAPTSDVVEVTVIVRDPLRTRAVALRLEAGSGAWHVTALELG